MTFNAHNSRGPNWTPFGGRNTYDRGYPVPLSEVKVGYMNNAEIMADAPGEAITVSQKRTAHNEVTRVTTTGVQVCRLRETDIVALSLDGSFTLDTGGWNTPTTKRHMVDFLKRNKIPVTLWGDKKRGGIILRDLRGENPREIIFKSLVTVFADGSWLADYREGE
jgi:hypothetical protein